MDRVDEWRSELAGEVDSPTPRKLLPVVASRTELGPLLQSLPLRTLYAGALREGELRELHRRDLEEGALQVGARRVPIDSETHAALTLRPDGPLFGDEASPDALRAALSPLQPRYAAVGRALTPAALRHAAATHLLEGGMDLFALHRMLGNTYLTTTERYRSAALPRALRLASNSKVVAPTTEETQLLLNASPREADRRLLRLAYSCAARRNELLKLTRADLWPEDGRVLIREGKKGWDRYALADAAALQGFGEAMHAPVSHIRSESGFDAMFRRLASVTGLREKYAERGLKLTLHSLRHAWATHAYAAGMPLELIQARLGHDDLKSTSYYVEVTWEQCVEAASR